MENNSNGGVPTALEKKKNFSFKELFMESVDLIKKDPVNVLIVGGGPTLVATVISGVFAASIVAQLYLGFSIGNLGAGAVTSLLTLLLLIVLAFVFAFAAYLWSFKVVQQIDSGKADLVAAVNFVKVRLNDAVGLFVKIVLYTQIWINFLIGIGGILIGVLIPNLIFLVWLAPLASLVVFILNFKKYFNVAFAYYELINEEKISADEAIARSSKIMNGQIWNYLLNFIILGILTSIANGLIGGLFGGSEIAITFAGAITAAFTYVFMFIFWKKLHAVK